MSTHESGTRHAIAIEEDESVSVRCPDREVAGSGESESVILLSNVAEHQFRPGLRGSGDDLRGFRPRTVVGDDDLEVPITLP